MKKSIHPVSPVIRNPQFAKEVFDAASQPRTWLRVAQNLRSSAVAILERENPIAKRFFDELAQMDVNAEFDERRFPRGNFDAAYMLIAFSIENFLKGIIIAKKIISFSTQELPGQLKTHNLNKLHALANPKAQIKPVLLDVLFYMAEWRGRYPFPTSVEGFWPIDEQGIPVAIGYSWPESQNEFLSYCDDLERELNSLI